jgi:hypothetical protein
MFDQEMVFFVAVMLFASLSEMLLNFFYKLYITLVEYLHLNKLYYKKMVILSFLYSEVNIKMKKLHDLFQIN